MKKFYTVKEAAKILGFSTNTIYTHLDEGSLKGKRVGGRGRFKIPYSELAPYLEASNEEKVINVAAPQAVMAQKVGIGWTAVGVVIGAAIGYSALNFSMPKLVTDIASETLSYSTRTSVGMGNIVETQAPKIGEGAKALAAVFASRLNFKTKPVELAESTPNPVANTINQIMVRVPTTAGVNIREDASTSAKIIAKIDSTKVAEKIGETEGWTKVSISNYPAGWVSDQFIAEAASQNVVLGATSEFAGRKVTIDSISTGWLRVRNAPAGAEIGKVSSGETFIVLDKSGDWYLIEIPGSTNGWISSQYTTLQ